MWVNVAKQKLGEVPKVPNIKEFLDEYEFQRPKSNDDIIDRLQAFTNRISLGKMGKFICPVEGDREISVEIKGSEDRLEVFPDSSTNFDFQYNCIAINGIGNGSLVAPRPLKFPFPIVGVHLAFGSVFTAIKYQEKDLFKAY